MLWTYHTTPRELTGEIPFKLSFRIEAIVPIEILSETSRIKVKQLDIVATSTELDLLKGVIEIATINMAAYKRNVA